MKLKRKKKGNGIDEKTVGIIVKNELNDYIRRDDLKEALREIEQDKQKKALWDALPASKKLKVLRHALKRKGEEHGKK